MDSQRHVRQGRPRRAEPRRCRQGGRSGVQAHLGEVARAKADIGSQRGTANCCSTQQLNHDTWCNAHLSEPGFVLAGTAACALTKPRSEGFLLHYVDARRASATKYMGVFQQATWI